MKIQNLYDGVLGYSEGMEIHLPTTLPIIQQQ